MTSLTIQISDDLARGLSAEASLRRISIEQVAVERIATQATPRIPKPTPARMPVRLENAESVIGSFADRPDLLDSVQAVIEDRARRYAESA